MDKDQESLELAARAVGMCGHMIGDDFIACIDHEFCKADYLWNPLRNDTYALRLVVKLNLQIAMYTHGTGWVKVGSITELTGNDPYAATRRAIVRAAAELGKGMK